MKVVLHAFAGKLKSEPMDIPEGQGPRWKMVLTKPITMVQDFSGNEIGTQPPMGTLCEFEGTGKIDPFTMAEIYELIDIRKL